MAEAPTKRISRMLTLVPWLASRPGVTLRETAEHFGITQETLEADLWQIILCGVPGYGPDQLVDIDFWDDGEIYVHDVQTLTAPLRLSSEETTAILLGLRALAQTPGRDGGDAVISAAAKIHDALDLADDGSQIVLAESPPAAISETMQDAIGRGLRVTLEYGAADGHVTVRDVWPRQALTIDGYTYITGWCERAESVRTFRLDRVLRAGLSADQGSTPVIDEFPWWEALNTHRARVRVSAARPWILDEAHDVELERDEGAWLEATIGFASITWVTAWVVRNSGSVIVLDPPWVVEAVLTQAERLLQAPLIRRG